MFLCRASSSLALNAVLNLLRDIFKTTAIIVVGVVKKKFPVSSLDIISEVDHTLSAAAAATEQRTVLLFVTSLDVLCASGWLPKSAVKCFRPKAHGAISLTKAFFPP